MRRLRPLPYLFIFTIVMIVNSLSPVGQSADSRYFIHIASHFSLTGRLELDDYAQAVYFDAPMAYSTRVVRDHIYSIYPPALPILISPLVSLLNILGSGRLDELLHYAVAPGLEIYIASLIVALTCAVLLAIMRRFLTMRMAIVTVLVFAFCTAAWSTASRALWQHGPTMLLLSIALLFAVNNRHIAWSGFFLGLAYSVRPTSLLSLVAIGVYIFICNRQQIIKFAGLALLAIVPFTLITYATYGTLQSPNYATSYLSLHPAYVEALLGNLISPSRGLIAFSPVVIISFIGAVIWIRQRNILAIILSVVITLYWLIMSSWAQWYAGWSYGPRYMSDMLPYLLFLSIPSVQYIKNTSNRSLKVLVGVLIVVSFVFNARGALADSTWNWNATPVEISHATYRLWDWHDPQFFR